MKETVETGENIPRAFLIEIKDKQTQGSAVDFAGLEFSGLVDTLGLEIAALELVNVRQSQARYGMGSGKAAELAQKAASKEADCIIFDRDLSPSQQKNWEDLTGLPVIDRQELIIQIFASRACTREAELQVRLAELIYELPRLRHRHIDLSRQRGGRYGTRGSGETRFETDRRKVEQRVRQLEEELELLARQRQVQRRKRERQSVPVCALVGYTNAGKSTIFNALTAAGVLVENKLFATLDSTSRRLALPGGTQALLVDTVGFIKKLPHSLIKAFRSTLEEASLAELLINVLDASSINTDEQYKTTLSVLNEIGADKIPMITVLNKIDRVGTSEEAECLIKLHPGSIGVSAISGRGLKELCERIEASLASGSPE
jgi:GTP-binding protein HflX